jgi:hypothetical protein
MKFATFIIETLCGLLTFSLLCGFLFFGSRYQQDTDKYNLIYANASLLLFVVSAVITALLSIAFDAYKNKSGNIADNKTQPADENNNRSPDFDDNLIQKLHEISEAHIKTNQLLNEQINSMNDVLKTYKAATEESVNQHNLTIAKIDDVCANLFKLVDSAKGFQQKDNEHSGAFDVLLQTLSAQNSDVLNLNNNMLESIRQIKDNVTQIIQNRNNVDSNIKLSATAPVEKNDVNNVDSADFYTDSFKSEDINETVPENTIPENITPDVEEEVSELPQQTAEQPQEQYLEQPAVADMDSTLTEEPVNEETFNTPDYNFNFNDAPALDESQKINLDEMSFNTPDFNYDFNNQNFNNDFSVPEFTDTPLEDTDFFQNISQPATDFNDNQVAENQVVTDNNQTDTPQVDDFSLAADNPFGVQVTNDLSQVEEQPIDLNNFLGADSPFGPSSDYIETQNAQTTENDDSQIRLDNIFNDDFATEMADLDILKDDGNTQNKDDAENDIDNLLNK